MGLIEKYDNNNRLIFSMYSTTPKTNTSSLVYNAPPLILLLLLTVALSGLQRASAQEYAYVESNGLVVIQAESLEPVGDWVHESSDAGFTGDGYIRWNGPNLYGTPGVGTLAYKVYISEPGDYNVRLRMSHLGAPAGDQWNDCWAKMDDGSWAKALHPADKMQAGFTFDSILEPEFGVFENMRYTLSAGFHTLYISGRSENLRVDRIHFYKDNVPNPLDLSLQESPFQLVEDNSDDDGNDDNNDDGDDGNNDDGDDDDNHDLPTAVVSITGELKKWHPITLTMDGPNSDEYAEPNPFLDYRFEVTFSQSGRSFTVPGYFAADGNAADSSSLAGNKWRAHFVPDDIGTWEYTISMRSGDNIAIDSSPSSGTPMDQDGATGSFIVEETDKTDRDHRGKGILRYVNEHYLQFDNGEYFLKGGANSPENLLAYEDFDGTWNHAGQNYIKSYDDHVMDWNVGDPTWRGDRGKGLIGALNYLSSEGMNAVYFITMNVNGDGNDVWPWVAPDQQQRYDVSKLAQWEKVFTHMDEKGIMLHVLLEETENELLLNNGALGIERKLYYRELIARFGHHHALTWNLGEESDEHTEAELKEFSSYIRSLDAYNHPIVLHTYPGQQDDIYTPLLGFEDFEGASLQVAELDDIHQEVITWRELSAEAGRPWIVSMDEIGPYQIGVSENGPASNHQDLRTQALWATLMAGGAGVEWYFGYDNEQNDLTAENWRTRSTIWAYTRYALEFFHSHLPFATMQPMDELTEREDDYIFVQPDSIFTIYMPVGDSLHLNLPGATYKLGWFNPHVGGELVEHGTVVFSGDSTQFVGLPPGDLAYDWVALLTRISPLDEPEEEAEPYPMEIVGFTLLDADTNTEVMALRDGDILDLGLLPPHLNVRAETRVDEDQRIQYVMLELNPTGVTRKEVVAPYALFGDIAGDYLPGTFEQGELTLSATPFGLDGNYNDPGQSLTITVTVGGHNPATQASLHVGYFEEKAGHEVAREDPDLPTRFTLETNYPNPFNPTTTIPFSITETGHVRLAVYDMQGRVVRVLIDRVIQPGRQEVTFDAAGLPSGTYFYRIETAGLRQTHKMMLLK